MSKEKSISESLRYIYDKFGIDTFQDENKIHSMLIDLSPKSKVEIGWVMESLNNGSIKPLLDSVKNNSNLEEAKSQCVKKLKMNELSDIRVDYMLSCFSYGFRLTDKLESLDDIKRRKDEAKRLKEQKLKEQRLKEQKLREQKLKEAKEQENKKKNINKQTTKQTIKQDNKKQTTKQSYNSKNNNQKNTNDTDKLKNLYRSLHSVVDDYININVKNNAPMQGTFTYRLSQIVNIVLMLLVARFLLCYAFNIKGNIYKLDLAIEVVAAIIGINLVKTYIGNIKARSFSIKKRSILNALTKNRDGVEITLKYIEGQNILSQEEYRKYESILNGYHTEFYKYKNKWEGLSKNYSFFDGYKIPLLLVFTAIFIGLGIRETNMLSEDKKVADMPLVNSVVEKVGQRIYKNNYYGYLTTDGNVRSKPTVDSDIVYVADAYEPITLTGKSYEGETAIWYETAYSKGWISEKVITIIPKEVEVTEEVANVRYSAGLYTRVCGVAERGDILYTTGKAKDKDGRIWYQVYFESEKRWISSNIVQEVD